MTQTSKYACCSGLRDEAASQLFKALCDPTRMAILVRLTDCCGERTVSSVAECCPIDISVVSRHLTTLRNAGVVRAVKRGKEVFYSVRTDALAKSLRAIADELEACCPSTKEDSSE